MMHSKIYLKDYLSPTLKLDISNVFHRKKQKVENCRVCVYPSFLLSKGGNYHNQTVVKLISMLINWLSDTGKNAVINRERE